MSLKLDWIKHFTQGEFFNTRADCVEGRFTRWLNQAIDAALDCPLILVQMAADPHVFDVFGGLLTTVEMGDRDRLVFERLKNKSVVWFLGGGYQCVKNAKTLSEKLEPVLSLHRQTARIACEIQRGVANA